MGANVREPALAAGAAGYQGPRGCPRLWRQARERSQSWPARLRPAQHGAFLGVPRTIALISHMGLHSPCRHVPSNAAPQVPKALDPETMAAMRAEMEAALKRQLLNGRLSSSGAAGGGGGGGLGAALTQEEVEKVGRRRDCARACRVLCFYVFGHAGPCACWFKGRLGTAAAGTLPPGPSRCGAPFSAACLLDERMTQHYINTHPALPPPPRSGPRRRPRRRRGRPSWRRSARGWRRRRPSTSASRSSWRWAPERGAAAWGEGPVTTRWVASPGGGLQGAAAHPLQLSPG